MSQDPFAKRKEENAKAREKADAEESMHLKNLLENESGKWLLGRIIRDFEAEICREGSGHNSVDSYHRGIQDANRGYRDLIIKYFGHSAIDKLMKGKQ